MDKIEDTFPKFIEYVLGAEGVHANDKNDRGGETWYGLSSKFLDGIGWGAAPPSRQQAIDVYYKYFWKGYQCDKMHPFVAWCACDAFIQHPPVVAVRLLQTGLEVPVDGELGPKTLSATQNPNLISFWRRYRLARIRFYNNIVAKDPTQVDFVNGWQERMHKLAEEMYFANIIDNSGYTGVKAAITSDNSKVIGIGSVVTVIAGGLTYFGIDPQSAQDWLINVLPAGSTLGLAAAWIAKTLIKKG